MIVCITGSRDGCIWYHDWFDLWNLSTGGFCRCTGNWRFSEYASLSVNYINVCEHSACNHSDETLKKD